MSPIDPLDVALGEAPPDEAARRMQDPAFRAEVERLAPVVARLEHQPRDAWDPPAPPPLQVGAPAPVRAPRRRRAAFVLRPAVGFAASLVLIAAGVVLGVTLDDDPGDGRVTLAALPGAQGRAELVRRGERVELAASGLRPDARGFHELWLLPSDGQGDPVPIGRFRVRADGTATGRYTLPGDPARFALFDVSEEPADGDPHHSGKSVLQAPTGSRS
jgi:anti-sigma-K factor RskA